MGLPRRKTVMVLVPAPGRRRGGPEKWWSALAGGEGDSAGIERDRSAEPEPDQDGAGAPVPSEEGQ
jgi:hypothetical protein